MTMTLPETRYAKARVLDEPPFDPVRRWLDAGWADYKANRELSLIYGGVLVALGWITIGLLKLTALEWMILPLLAGAVLVGPLATVGLYVVARGERSVASAGQIALVGVTLMVFALVWIRAATILFAITYGLRPFLGFWDTLALMLTTPSGWALLIGGSLVGGLFAALGFAISAFSLPMLVDREIDGFSAMGLSFNATTQNFKVAVAWGATITALTGIGILTGLLGLIVIFPVLGYATWHAYADLFKGEQP